MAEIDSLNIKGMVLGIPDQIKEGLKLAEKFKIVDPLVDKIVIIGMGGSGIAGKILKNYLRNEKIRIDVINDYSLPNFVDENTLVIVCSYSGDTEETLSAYKQAFKKKSKIIALTTGGKLKELCEKYNHEHLILKKGFMPRQSAPYMFFIMLKILENSKLIVNHTQYVKDTVDALKKPIFIDMAKQLAVSLKDKVPLIYSSSILEAIAYRWKCEFNENTKIHAFNNVLSELDHNEIVGYTKKLADFHVIFLRDVMETRQMEKRISITKKLIMEKGYSTTEILIKGPNELSRLFSALYIGDLTSYFLAQEYGIDPGPVDIIFDLKEMLKE